MERQDAAARGRWAVAGMFLANGFLMGSWAPQIPLLLPRHQIGEGVLGLLILGLGAGAVAAMAMSGRIIARIGTARALAIFAPASCLGLPLVVLAPTLATVAVAMALFGAAIGCMDVAMNANAVEVERRLDRAIMSSSHGFWSLGGFAGGGLGGLAIAGIGAAAHAGAVAALALAVVLAMRARLVVEPLAPRTPDAAPVRHWPRGVGVYLIGVMALFSMVPEGAVLDWAALYLMQDLGAPVGTAGFAFAAFSGAMALMRFAGDAVRNRFGAVRTLRMSGLVAAAGMLAGGLAPSAPLAVAAFALSGLGIANMVPIALSAAGNQPGVSAGSGIAVATLLGYSGILIAPSLIGVAAETVGFRPTYLVLAALLAVVAALAGRAAAADLETAPPPAPEAPRPAAG